MNTELMIVNTEEGYTTEERQRFTKLHRLHLAAAVFMGIQTIAYGAAGADASVSPTVGFPIDCQDGPICTPNMKVYSDQDPVFLIILFVALSSFDHFVTWGIAYLYPDIAMKWLFRYQSNPLRWFEYSISAAIMAVAIAILSGIHDVHLWFLILLTHTVGMFLGYVIEIIPHPGMIGYDPQSKLVPIFSHLRYVCYMISSLSISIPWLVIFCYFFNAAKNGDGIPDFVYAAFLGTFVLFLTFAANSAACHLYNRYDFATAEMIYIILSFTAKTFLAADVFGGLNASTDDD
jgi:hypothetical protein